MTDPQIRFVEPSRKLVRQHARRVGRTEALRRLEQAGIAMGAAFVHMGASAKELRGGFVAFGKAMHAMLECRHCHIRRSRRQTWHLSWCPSNGANNGR
jgi:hypothetical protein